MYLLLVCVTEPSLSVFPAIFQLEKIQLHHHLNYSSASVWLAFEESLYNIADFGLYLKFVNVLKELQESKRSVGYSPVPLLRYVNVLHNYLIIQNML